ncbi:MAG: DUF1801 domain-containing protein [Vicingaceae bacterium]
MQEVENYILNRGQTQKDCLLFFHQLFIDNYHLKPKLNYGIPFYYGEKWVVYLNPSKTGSGVELAFINGYLFSKDSRSLESKGRKMVRSKTYHNLIEINLKELEEWMELALEVDKSLSLKRNK